MRAAGIYGATMMFMAVLSGCAARQGGRKPQPPGSTAVAQSANATDETAKAIESQEKTSEPCEKRAYKSKLMADGYYTIPGSKLPEDRGHFGVNVYTAPDGNTVSWTHTVFQSPQVAAKAFRAMVSSSGRILEHGPTKGHESPSDSERLVTTSGGAFNIYWRRENSVYSLQASSLQDLRDFEEVIELDCK